MAARLPLTLAMGILGSIAAGCAAPPPSASPPPLGLVVQLEGEAIACKNTDPSREVRFLTFERERSREAYGVYALHDAKASMTVPLPLSGNAIAWGDVDARGALRRLAPEVEPDPAWFEEGLRVLLVVEGEPSGEVPTWPVVVVELR